MLSIGAEYFLLSLLIPYCLTRSVTVRFLSAVLSLCVRPMQDCPALHSQGLAAVKCGPLGSGQFLCKRKLLCPRGSPVPEPVTGSVSAAGTHSLPPPPAWLFVAWVPLLSESRGWSLEKIYKSHFYGNCRPVIPVQNPVTISQWDVNRDTE